MMSQTRAIEPNSSRLVRLMIANWAFGWAIGFVGAAAVLALEHGRHSRSDDSSPTSCGKALALLFGGFGFTFGGVVCATAVMLLPIDETECRSGGGGHARAGVAARLTPWRGSAKRAPD